MVAIVGSSNKPAGGPGTFDIHSYLTKKTDVTFFFKRKNVVERQARIIALNSWQAKHNTVPVSVDTITRVIIVKGLI
jgi:hypothetical protein